MSVSPDSNQPSLVPASVDLIDFTRLDSDTSTKVLEWRNHEAVRRWMLRTSPISEAEHEAFLQALKHDTTKRYFVIMLKGEAIAVIDFYRIHPDKRSCYFGYYLRPDKIGSSLGILLEFLVAEYALVNLGMDQLIAETMPTNTSAMELHQRFGFEPAGVNTSALQEAVLTAKIWHTRRDNFAAIIERLTS